MASKRRSSVSVRTIKEKELGLKEAKRSVEVIELGEFENAEKDIFGATDQLQTQYSATDDDIEITNSPLVILKIL